MTLRLRITQRAAAEIERADAWWREHRQAVPNALRDDLRAAFDLLAFQPGIGERVLNARLHGTRSLQIDRIRYDLYYIVRGDELWVLSLWHSQRGRQPRL
ncbi:MAG: type II toxin-antitoxin system RelE/ParE family toxin [Rubrivivax sp.]|nr:type II toxin-antitoxin system RelE/ParE family toxin [Rubrivivax sp.]MCL4698105.1 type II toxin-antitoxin system RelE/ParE family toxin [Burkholderiaceae bacterium]